VVGHRAETGGRWTLVSPTSSMTFGVPKVQ
jgi:hypothetical protein